MLHLIKLKGILIWYIFIVSFFYSHKKEHINKIKIFFTLHIQSFTLLLNSELSVTVVSLSLVLCSQEPGRWYSTSGNMLYYSSWDFLSNSLCSLHNFGLPFSYLANFMYCFFLNWVTCHWKLSSFCSKSKLVDTFWQIDAWSLNVSFAECTKPLVSSAVFCLQISSSPPRDLAVSLPPVVLLVWQYQRA